MKTVISVHYGEIALKGQNRCEFEARLVKNIKKALDGEKIEKISRSQSRVFVELNEDCTNEDVSSISAKLKRVFGIECFFISYSLEKDIEKVSRFITDRLSKKQDMPETPVKIDVKRSDKRFSMTSPEVGTMIARALDNAEVSVELTGYKSTIYVQILNDEILVSFGKVNGLGGLPVGSSGRVLVLLSGGIDSPVAAIRMMKRGCNIDLLHFYQFPNHEEVLKSKIMQIVAVLREYGFSGKLYLAPYSEFYKHTFDSVPQKKELVMFRRFILKVANELAKENKTLGIASGDNLAQVASQTLENLYATNEASKLPVYRPLVSYDKAEIIKLAKEYGTYDASIEEYKDCCSLVAVKHPETKAKLEEIKEIEDKIGVDKIVEETIKKIKIIA